MDLRKSLPRAALATMLLAAGVQAETTIVVNSGRFPSAEAASRAEAEVNWLDADTADDTACTECFAATELQHYLRKMTGREDDFALVNDRAQPPGDLILVGGPASNAANRRLAGEFGAEPKQLADLGPEGYCIRSATAAGRRVVLVAGGGRVGTLYGAYDFLYRLGCRWFAPGELHEDVPRTEQIAVADAVERPSYLTRGFLAWEDRGDPDFLLWMARNRLDYWCVEQKQHALLRKLGIKMVCGLHDAEQLFLNPVGPYPYEHPRFPAQPPKPKDPYPVSEQYQGDANQDGKLSYFEAHPEWFAFEGSRRVPGIGWSGTNFCTSNPHAVTEFFKNYVQALIDGPYREADMVRFWTLDGGKWCQCPECKTMGIPTDRNLLLVHRLDQEIKKARAEGKIQRPISITFLAYADVLEPPTRPLPAGFDYEMCAATFYPIVRCYLHNFDEPSCRANDRYRGQLHGWATEPQRHYRGQIAIGEYYNVSGYKCLPICFMHSMANDIPYYYQTGARHFDYMHVTTGNWGSKALTNYQMARQLWDVRADCEALWKDYFARRYGPAADTMRLFYEALERMLSGVSELKYGLAGRLQRGAAELFPTPHLRYRREPGLACDGTTLVEIVEHSRTCRELLGRALGMELPQRLKDRIAEDERAFTYGERTVAYFHECVQAFQEVRAGRPEAARQHYAEALRLADLLRQDKTSAKLSSSHANATDASAASYAAKALDCLGKLLETPPPSKAKGEPH